MASRYGAKHAWLSAKRLRIAAQSAGARPLSDPAVFAGGRLLPLAARAGSGTGAVVPVLGVALPGVARGSFGGSAASKGSDSSEAAAAATTWTMKAFTVTAPAWGAVADEVYRRRVDAKEQGMFHPGSLIASSISTAE